MRRKSDNLDAKTLARAKVRIAAGVSASAVSLSLGMTRDAIGKALRKEKRLAGRVADGTALETRQTETSRGFESHANRQ